MNKFLVAYLLLTQIILFDTYSQNRIKINIPSAEEETEYIWRTLQDIPFFEKDNYQVSLPNGMLIDSLKLKSKRNTLTDNDYNDLRAFMVDSIYNKVDYESGYYKIHEQLNLLNKMLSELTEIERNWIFKNFEIYEINLTLYGPGGSYNPDEGSVLIYITPNGAFKNYDDPANTLIHEIIHIGIEESIVSKHNVPHPLKERIVDKLVFLCFGQYLPEYRIQQMGDTRIDEYLKTKDDIRDLENFVVEILE